MLISIIKQTLMITSFVLAMMLILEYINVLTKGNLNKPFRKSGWLQIISAGLLGIIPGCLGAYTAVSMYAHKIFSFPAIITTMIATSGDEAFLMFSLMPEYAILINVTLFVIAVTTGLILFLFMKNKSLMKLKENHMQIHNEHPDCVCFNIRSIGNQLVNISFQRIILISSLALFIFFLLTGDLGHSHDFENLLHGSGHVHAHDHENNNWNWIKITFLIISSVSLLIILTVDDHFIEEHLWKHILKKHFLKILLWTFGALILLHFINLYLEPEKWLESNHITIILFAVLLGIIPQSGPHFIFVLLFIQGNIPFSVLLANSIVQDGHGAIPLLAESRKSFFLMKLANIIIGLIIGLSGLFINW